MTKQRISPHIHCIYSKQEWEGGDWKTSSYVVNCYKNKSKEKCKGRKKCQYFTPEKVPSEIYSTMTTYYRTSYSMFAELFSRLFGEEQRKFERSKEGCDHRRRRNKMGHFHFIPRSMDQAIKMILAARQYLNDPTKQAKFLDAGCGVGNIVMMAYTFGFDAYGIEYDVKTLNRGKRLFKQFDINADRLMRGDILKFNNYADYDVIYTYNPMQDGNLERKFEAKVLREAKIGAVLIGFWHGDQPLVEKERRYFFQKIDMTLAKNDTFVNMCVKIGER
jgi:SAM-dependent methyltransferase